jgi:hypothetical protein
MSTTDLAKHLNIDQVVHLATRGNQTDKPYLEFISNLDSFPSISLSDIVSIRGNQD